MIDAAYDACIRLADGALRRPRLALLVTLAPMLAVSLAIGHFILRAFPNSSDEYVYLYEAATMAAGRLWNHTPPSPEAFVFTYIDVDGPRIWGSFPAGWPLALTAAMVLHVPVWLVNPLLGLATVVLVALLARNLYGARAAVWAALVIATMPYVLFNAASYFSHPLCGALLLGAACLATGESRNRPWAAAGVGFLLAWAILTRYFTGVICGFPIGLMLLRRGRIASTAEHRRFVARTTAWLIAGAVPWMIFLGWYNFTLNGSPWRLTTEAGTYARWFKPGFVLHGIDIMQSHIVRHLTWTPPALVVLYLLFLRRIPRERRIPLDWMLLAIALTLYFYFERGGNQYGTRFHYEAFLFATVFVVGQLFHRESMRGAPRWERMAFAAFALSLCAAPVQLAAHALIEARVVRERMDPFDSVRRHGLHDAVVFMENPIGTTRTMPARDLTRNGLTYDGPVLYAVSDGAAVDCAVMTHFPRRSAYVYRWSVGRRSGSLTPIECGPRPH